MNIRSYAQPLTIEDSAIWCMLRYRPGLAWLADAGMTKAAIADRRDAWLMWEVQKVVRYGPCSIEFFGIAFRGWDQAENGKLRGSQ